MESGYLKTARSGALQERIARAEEMLKSCTLCPRSCKVDRLAGEFGVCRTSARAELASYGPHFGEESVLVGQGGSGTIFFCGCSLQCVFCQNYTISHPHPGGCRAVSDLQLAEVMVELQQQGCQNINLVTPTHVVPQVLAALPHAIDRGLTIPLVYNSSGYDEVESLRLLDGIVDIYMPDFKFWSSATARRYADAPDYPEKACLSLLEMHRQVGDLQVSAGGVAEKGLMVRHLLMPEMFEETAEILKFLAEEISTACYVNIMDQYHPCGEVSAYPELQQGVPHSDYKAAHKRAGAVGLWRLDSKDFSEILRRLLR